MERDLDDITGISEIIADYSKSLSPDSVSPERVESFFKNLFSRDISSTRADLEEEIFQLSRQTDMLSSLRNEEARKDER